LPASIGDFVPEDHLARFGVALVRESLDLRAITAHYASPLGQPPFDPRLMVALLLHGYASGIYSSRRIAKACRERADFMMIVALDAPDFRPISDFRKRHLQALAALFVQVLRLAETAGLVKLGHVALDGTKIKANASKHKAMSYARMTKREAELQAEVERWLAAAEAADAEEDAAFGKEDQGRLHPRLQRAGRGGRRGAGHRRAWPDAEHERSGSAGRARRWQAVNRRADGDTRDRRRGGSPTPGALRCARRHPGRRLWESRESCLSSTTRSSCFGRGSKGRWQRP
jgi:transposase